MSPSIEMEHRKKRDRRWRSPRSRPSLRPLVVKMAMPLPTWPTYDLEKPEEVSWVWSQMRLLSLDQDAKTQTACRVVRHQTHLPPTCPKVPGVRPL